MLGVKMEDIRLEIPQPTVPGIRQIKGPEDLNAYEKKRAKQAESRLKLGKIAFGATVAVGVMGIVLSGLNYSSNQDKPPGQ